MITEFPFQFHFMFIVIDGTLRWLKWIPSCLYSLLKAMMHQPTPFKAKTEQPIKLLSVLGLRTRPRGKGGKTNHRTLIDSLAQQEVGGQSQNSSYFIGYASERPFPFCLDERIEFVALASWCGPNSWGSCQHDGSRESIQNIASLRRFQFQMVLCKMSIKKRCVDSQGWTGLTTAPLCFGVDKSVANLMQPKLWVAVVGRHHRAFMVHRQLTNTATCHCTFERKTCRSTSRLFVAFDFALEWYTRFAICAVKNDSHL